MDETRIITLLTDYGLRDCYVGALKGAILSVYSGAQIIDVAHTIAKQDVLEAAYLINGYYKSFPKGTIHLAVVDPGVGGPRRPILVESRNHFFLGPDNGIFSYVFEREQVAQVVHLTATQYFATDVSDTFHGRDIFGPVAAHLASGVEARWLGKPIEDFLKLPLPQLKAAGTMLSGEVVYVDRYGNLVTNIDLASFYALVKGKQYTIAAGQTTIGGISRSYVDGQPGQLLALFGCQQTLELSVNQGSAASMLGQGRGLKIIVQAT
jgi:S-adenosylmethionine hydrolase